METVLVVDDELWLLELLPEQIEECGAAGGAFRIVTVSTPEEALAVIERLAAEEATPCVTVLSDYNLNGSVDGIELLGRIAERLPRSRRVLMSSHSRQDLEEHLRHAALHDFFEKPMHFHEWGPELARTIGGRRTTEIDGVGQGGGA